MAVGCTDDLRHINVGSIVWKLVVSQRVCEVDIITLGCLKRTPPASIRHWSFAFGTFGSWMIVRVIASDMLNCCDVNISRTASE